jgi:RNA polymerase subunit RPABC4/transcription elongation factor Spt4
MKICVSCKKVLKETAKKCPLYGGVDLAHIEMKY